MEDSESTHPSSQNEYKLNDVRKLTPLRYVDNDFETMKYDIHSYSRPNINKRPENLLNDHVFRQVSKEAENLLPMLDANKALSNSANRNEQDNGSSYNKFNNSEENESSQIRSNSSKLNDPHYNGGSAMMRYNTRQKKLNQYNNMNKMTPN